MVSNSYKTKGDSPMNPKQQELRQLEKSVSLDPIIYMSSPSPLISVVPSPGRDYACRQRYLRSYTLDANYNNKPKQMMSPAQRAKNWFLRKEKKQTTKSTDCNSMSSFEDAASKLQAGRLALMAGDVIKTQRLQGVTIISIRARSYEEFSRSGFVIETEEHKSWNQDGLHRCMLQG
ncbi:hypothetical protein ACET3Z_011146 [Daucus carota]